MANEFKVKKGLVVDGSGTVVDIQGTVGQLFSVTDSLTGDLFSVSDVSGVPILNVNSSGIIKIDGSLTLTETLLSKEISIKQQDDAGFDAGLTIERSANTQKVHIGMDGGAVNFNSPDGLAYKFRNNGTITFELDGNGYGQIANRLQVGKAGGASNTGRLDLFGRYSSGSTQPTIFFKTDHPSNSTQWDMAQINAADGGNYNGQLYFKVASGSGSAGNAASLATALLIDDTKDATFYGSITTDSSITTDRLSLFTSNTDRATVQAGSSGTTGHLYFNSYTGTTLKQLTWSAANSGFYPQGASGSFDLGLTGNRWNRVFANYFYGDGSNLTGVASCGNADTVDNLHASDFLQAGGSWNGANMPGSRYVGMAVNGGEVVFQRDNPNNAQMSILVDGAFYAGENNGFYSLYSGNSYNSKAGFYADSNGVLQFNAAGTFSGDIVGGGNNYLNHSNQYNNSTPGVTGFGNAAMDTSISFYDTGKTVSTATRGIVWTGKHYIVTDYSAQQARFYDSNFDTVKGPFGDTISLPNDGNTDHPHGAAWDGRYLYCIQYTGSGAKIVAYDLDNGTSTATVVFTKAMNNTTATYDIEYADGHLYTVTDGAVSIYRVDGQTITHVSTSGNILSSLEAQAITYDGSYLWVTQNGHNMYKVRLNATLAATLTTLIPPDNVAMAWNGKNIATVNHTNGKVYIVNNKQTRFDTELFQVSGGNLRLESGTGGTTNKLIFKTTDNADENKFIRTNAYWMEFGGHANEGFKFVDTGGTILLQLNGGQQTGGNGANSATFAGRITAPTQTLTSSDSTLLTLNPTANSYGGILFQYGGSNKGFSVYNSGSMVYGGESGVGTILQVNGQHALNIDTSKNATFSGTVKVKGASMGTTQADGDYITKLYTASADGFLELFTGEGTPVSRVKLSSYGNSYINPAASGKLGINTSSPRYQLDLAKVDDAAQTDYIALGVNNGNAAGTGTGLGTGIVWKAHYSGYSKRSAGIMQVAQGNYFRSGLAFYTNNATSSSSDWVQRMYLDMDGKLILDPGTGVDVGSTVLDVQGSEGQLFSVTNSLTGDLFSVSDVSGMPIFNVNSSGDVDIDGHLNLPPNHFIFCKGAGTQQSFFGFANDGHLRFAVGGADRFHIDNNGVQMLSTLTSRQITPDVDSSYDLGTNTVRYRNVYADTLYGDGSNLTGVSTGTPSNMVTTNTTQTISGTKTFSSVPYFNSSSVNARFSYTAGSQGSQIEGSSTAQQTFRCDSDRLRFWMGGTGGSQETLTIAESGRIGIKKASPAYTLDVNGSVSNVSIYASHDIAAYSDARVKTDVETIPDALEKVNKLRGVTFKRTDEGASDKRMMGVIAQEVLDVIPEVVNKRESDGHYSVSYGNVVGILIEAVKELTAEVEELKKQIK